MGLYLKEGIWIARWRVGGKRVSRSTGCRNRRQAERVAAELAARAPGGDVPLGEWAALFFGPDCPRCARFAVEGRSISASYRRNGAGTIRRYLLPDPISTVLLEDLRRPDVLAFRDRIFRKLGPTRTAALVMSLLGVVVHEALYREMILDDPMARVGRVKVVERPRIALTLPALQAVLDPALYPDETVHQATVTAAMTGLRAGEVRALQWGDLDPAAGLIRVRRALSGDFGGVTLPKWGKVRTTAYPAALRAILEPRRGALDAWVFSRDRGAPLGYTRWARAFRAAARAAGAEGATLHGLRHTLATLLRERGIPDDKLRGAFGWSAPEVMDRYTHRDLYDLTDQSRMVDDLIGGGAHGRPE